MPKKLRKMLGDVNSLSVVSLRNLIDTQSKDTIRKWCLVDLIVSAPYRRKGIGTKLMDAAK